MVANSTGFGYDSFEDACLDAMVAAELGLKGDCDALGEMNCPLAKMLEEVLMLEIARIGTLGSDMSRDVLRSAPDCDDLDRRISMD
jgi:hypothetical protein